MSTTASPSPQTVDLTPWLSVGDVATVCAVSKRTVEEWVRTGRGPRFHRLGKHLRCAPADFQAWLDESVVDGARKSAPASENDGWD